MEEGRGTTRSGGGAGKRRRLLGDGGRPGAGAAAVGFGPIWEQEQDLEEAQRRKKKKGMCH